MDRKVNNESFHRWKHDHVTVAFKNFILQEIVKINEELIDGYNLLDLTPDEMAMRLARLVGRKEAYTLMLDVELDDLEEEEE